MKKAVSPMTVQSLLNEIQKFEKSGSFDVQSSRGRKRIDSTVVEETTKVQAVQSSDMKPGTARGIVRLLKRPVSTAHKTLGKIYIAILKKIAMCRSCVFLICHQEKLLLLNFFLA